MNYTDGFDTTPMPDIAGVGAEAVLYESDSTQVVRRRAADSGAFPTMVCKQSFGPQAQGVVRREAAILRRLAGVAGVVQLIDVVNEGDTLALVDEGGRSLAEADDVLRTDLNALLSFAVRVSEVLAEIHRRGVIHRDISPTNIVVGDDGNPVVIDFGLATTFTEEQANVPIQHLAGTLAYLAPEQTGRTGRPIDARADLYSWGATLFELLTGQPPFVADSAARLLYGHLAKVPQPVIELNPAVPPLLSAIVARLLEKEPDARYQSADGLAFDLAHLRDDLAAGRPGIFDVGARDFPARLAAPTRLVGRDAEIALLGEAYQSAIAGRGRGMLVSGTAGVGKTVLIDQLRPVVTAAGGWFVAGKFDQYRRGSGEDAVRQALRHLGRLLLAEPGLDALRESLLAALGANASLAAEIAEFAQLLGIEPEPVETDPVQLAARMQRAVIEILTTVVTPERPVVIFLDDLQWAEAKSIGILDALLLEPDLAGLLVVGAFRGEEVDETHPLTGSLGRWTRLNAAPPVLALKNLPPTDLGGLIAAMLRLMPEQVADLAAELAERTGGNPFDTVELVNALRTDGAIVLQSEGWLWDAAAVRQYAAGRGNVVSLLHARIALLPEHNRDLLAVAACLGNEVAMVQLATAAGLELSAIEQELAPALEDGLLVLVRDPDGDAVRFRHDRIQQSAFTNLDEHLRAQLQLTIARRLLASQWYAEAAALQYLGAVSLIDDPDERRQIAALFHATAAGMRLGSDAAAERLLTAAVTLLAPIETPDDAELMLALAIDRHQALYVLGRLDDCDEAYAAIERRSTDPAQLLASTLHYGTTLAQRQRPAEAMEIGFKLLERLGFPINEDDGAVLGADTEEMFNWAAALDLDDDLERAEATDPLVMDLAGLVSGLLGGALFAGTRSNSVPALMRTAQRLWDRHGPCGPLVACLGLLPIVFAAIRQDRRTGYAVARHILAVGDARGYARTTAYARSFFVGNILPWVEPLEDCISEAAQTREALLQTCEFQQVNPVDLSAITFTFDRSPSLAASLKPIEAGIAFAARRGDISVSGCFPPMLQLVKALAGSTKSYGSFDDADFNEEAFVAEALGQPTAAFNYHLARAIGAAIFDDAQRLQQHTAPLAQMINFMPAIYVVSTVRVLRAMALADTARASSDDARLAVISEFDSHRGWLAERAADAPVNFAHLLRWLDAERAWATECQSAPADTFDDALTASADPFPWHRAVITRRAAMFHFERGDLNRGQSLIGECYQTLESWGADAVTTHLLEDHPFLRVDLRVA